MSQLIKVDSDGKTTAKELYEFLGLDSKNYSRWAESHIIKNKFAERGVDWESFLIHDERNPNPTTDYRLSIDFAKKLCMISTAVKDVDAEVIKMSEPPKINETRKLAALRILMGAAKRLIDRKRLLKLKADEPSPTTGE